MSKSRAAIQKLDTAGNIRVKTAQACAYVDDIAIKYQQKQKRIRREFR